MLGYQIQKLPLMTDEHREKFQSDLKQLLGSDAKDPVNIASLANRVGLSWLYNTVYRMSSSDVAHTTLDALEHHVGVNPQGEIVGLSFGPRVEKLADTLVGAMNCLLVSMHAIRTRFLMPELQPEIEQHLDAIQMLSKQV